MKRTEKKIDISLRLIDSITETNIRKNVIGTLFIGSGATILAIGIVIVKSKID